jgi:hypothetical protein
MSKIIFLFCYLFICCIPADVQRQIGQETPKVTIQFKNQSLDSTLCQLERRSGFGFVYQDTITGPSVKVNKKFKDKTLSQILDVLFAKSDYDYIVLDRRKDVILYRKKEAITVQNQETVLFSTTGMVVLAVVWNIL